MIIQKNSISYLQKSSTVNFSLRKIQLFLLELNTDPSDRFTSYQEWILTRTPLSHPPTAQLTGQAIRLPDYKKLFPRAGQGQLTMSVTPTQCRVPKTLPHSCLKWPHKMNTNKDYNDYLTRKIQRMKTL
jgi:hypothetical protein